MHIRFIRTLLFALVMLSMSAASFAQIGISINFAPPELPVYEQPLCPGDGYLWTPGYWAYGDDDYYWVPGTWSSMMATGVRMSVSMAELVTATVTSARATKVDVGITGTFSTTVR